MADVVDDSRGAVEAAPAGPVAAPATPDTVSLLEQMSKLLSLTTAHDFDVNEALTRLTRVCAGFAGANVAGVLFLQRDGALRPVAVSDEGPIAELFTVPEAGPCEEALAHGDLLALGNLTPHRHRWPRFAAKADAAGVRALYALPMQHDHTPIGCLKLLYQQPTLLEAPVVRALQAFAQVASVALLVRERGDTVEQLEHAIRSRAVVEQAKGVLSSNGMRSPETAFDAIRRYSRNRNMRVTVVAQGLVSGTLPVGDVIAEWRR